MRIQIWTLKKIKIISDVSNYFDSLIYKICFWSDRLSEEILKNLHENIYMDP